MKFDAIFFMEQGRKRKTDMFFIDRIIPSQGRPGIPIAGVLHAESREMLRRISGHTNLLMLIEKLEKPTGT